MLFGVMLILNVIVAITIALIFHAALAGDWPILWTAASTAAAFVIVLSLEQAILRMPYTASLLTYMTKTRERHLVTMIFGADILQRFLSDGFTEDLVRGVESLPWMLERLEEGDHPLPLVSYAMLLDKAAEMRPDRIWAVWNFMVVPIDEVFDTSGALTPNYRTYFQTLTRIYHRIRLAPNKSRLFIFENDSARRVAQNHAGWLTLQRYMKEWGLEGYGVTYSAVFESIKQVCPGATMDDFVLFGRSGFMSQEWVIGMKLKTRGVGLRHAGNAIGDFTRLWDRLDNESDHVLL